MKKLVSLFLIVTTIFMMFGCAESKTLDYHVENEIQQFEFKPYGLFNTDERNEHIKYDISIGNIIWSVLLVETIIVPIILVGWYLYEPVEYVGEGDLPKGAVTPVGTK